MRAWPRPRSRGAGRGATGPTCPSPRPDAAAPRRPDAQALALHRPLRRGADAVRGAGRDRPAGPVVLGDVGPRRAAATDAHTTLRPGSREVRMDGPRLEIDSPDLRASLRLGEVGADRNDLPQRLRLGLDPQARRRPDRGHGRGPGPALAGRGAWRRRRVGRLPPAPHQLALVGRGRRGRRRPPARLEPGRGRQRPAAGQRARDLARRRARTSRPRSASAASTASSSTPAPPLDFASESAHARNENFLLVRSRYRHRFGTFGGALDGTAAGQWLRGDGAARRGLVSTAIPAARPGMR